MRLVLLSFLVFLLAFAGLAAGVLFGRKPISGSCGGLNGPGGSCSLCGSGNGCDGSGDSAGEST